MVAVAGGFAGLVVVAALGPAARRLLSLGRAVAAGPWMPDPLALGEALVRHAATAAAVGMLVAGCLLAGRSTLARWLGPGGPRAVRPWLAFPLGFGLLSLGLLGWLLTGLWFGAVCWPFFVVFSLAGAVRRGRRRRATRLPTPFALAPARVGIAALLPVAVSLPWLLSPSTSADALTYDLAAPEAWLAAHGLQTRLAMPHWHFPLLSDLPSVYGLLLGLDAIPKWLEGAVFWCGAAALSTALGAGAAAWGVLALMLAPGTAGFWAAGKTDGFAAGYVLLATAAAVGGSRGAGAGVRAGVLGGFALGVKYTTLLNLTAPVVAALWLHRRGRGRWLGAAAAAAGVAAAGWYVKSALLTGDPVHPLGRNLLPGLFDDVDPRGRIAWARTLASVAAPAGRLRHGLAEALDYAGPVLALVPVALIAPPGLRCRAAGLAGLVVYLLWFLWQGTHGGAGRYGFPALAIALVATGSVLAGLFARGTGWRRRAGAILLAAAAGARLAALAPGHSRHPNPVPYAIGAESAVRHLATALTSYDEVRRGLAARAPTGRTILTGSYLQYGLPHPCGLGMPVDEVAAPFWWKLTREARTADDVRRRLRQLNAGMLVTQRIGSVPYWDAFEWTPAQVARYHRFSARWLEFEFMTAQADPLNGAFAAFRVRRSARGTPGGPVFFLPGAESVTRAGAEHLRHRRAEPAYAALAAIVHHGPPVGDHLALAALAAERSGRRAQAHRWYRRLVEAGYPDPMARAGLARTAGPGRSD